MKYHSAYKKLKHIKSYKENIIITAREATVSLPPFSSFFSVRGLNLFKKNVKQNRIMNNYTILQMLQ